jgi:hypothetical protein
LKKKYHDIFNPEEEQQNIPEDYFQTFNERVFRRIEGAKVSAKIENKVWRIIRAPLALAASIIGLAFIIYSSMNYLISDRKEINRLANNYYTQNIETELGYLSDETLLDVIEPLIIDAVEDDSMDDIIIEYLSASNIEYDILMSEL